MRQVWKVGKNLWSRLPCRFLLATVVAALLGVGAARAFIGSVSVVGGNSMSPNYPPGTWVYTAPISTPLERGDVVLIDDGNKDLAMKRIVGLPGEMVHLKHGYVFINRRILLEPYVPRKVYTFPREREGVCVLGEEQYFVLGDNRPTSTDSRTYGPITRDQIKRRIPSPDGTVRAHFGPNFLPAREAVLPQRTVSKVQS